MLILLILEFDSWNDHLGVWADPDYVACHNRVSKTLAVDLRLKPGAPPLPAEFHERDRWAALIAQAGARPVAIAFAKESGALQQAPLVHGEGPLLPVTRAYIVPADLSALKKFG